jgi:hypothetical protein
VPILTGEVPIVLPAHPTLFAIDAPLLSFEVPCLARGKLTALHTLPDAGLLVALALRNVMTLGVRRLRICRRSKEAWQHECGHRKGNGT